MIKHEVFINTAWVVSVLLASSRESISGITNVRHVTVVFWAIKLVHHISSLTIDGRRSR